MCNHSKSLRCFVNLDHEEIHKLSHLNLNKKNWVKNTISLSKAFLSKTNHIYLSFIDYIKFTMLAFRKNTTEQRRVATGFVETIRII